MDINILRETMTVVSFLVFIGIIVYAVHPKNRARFEEAARVPFIDDDGPSPQPSPRGEGANVGHGFAKWERK